MDIMPAHNPQQQSEAVSFENQKAATENMAITDIVHMVQ
jgi:hypothetical protein